MINIDFASISEQGLSTSVMNDIIHNQSLLIINDFPNDLSNSCPKNNTLLNQFIHKIGQPIVDFRSNSAVFEVKVSKSNDLFKSFANSNHYFSLHTDCSDFEVIPNGLAMLCVSPSKQGGESLFIKLDDVIAHLNDDELQMLLSKQWCFRKQKRSILSKDSSGNGYKVCYNRIMLESYAELTADELAFLDKFDDLLVSCSFECKLQKNQLVICNNQTLLHGRKAFDENEERLIKRIRFDFNTSLS